MTLLERGITPRAILITADNKVQVGRCLLVNAVLAAVAADSTAVIYDGVDITGEKKKTLTALAKCSDTWAPPMGSIFEFGIFIDISGASAEVTLEVLPIDSAKRE